MGRPELYYGLPKKFDSFVERSIPNVKNIILGYGRAKVAIRANIPRPCVPTYIIAVSCVGQWAAPSYITRYPKNSIVLEIVRYKMLKILFLGMDGLK